MKSPVIFSYCWAGGFLCLAVNAGCLRNSGQRQTVNDDSEQQVLDSVQRLVGKWKINIEATKMGWSDVKLDVPQMEKMDVDELTMWLHFDADKTVTISKNERSSEGFWTAKSKMKNSVTIEAFQDFTSERKAEFKITFLKNDPSLFQSTEMDGKDRLIFSRIPQDRHIALHRFLI